ncbi:MAG: hypothetical protein SGI77_20940 [Pirellulaceae bacterium]|nr:hypothetical protein [Pirellulaceae bacterium]
MNSSTNQESNAPKMSSTDGTVAVPRASIDWYRSLPWWRLLSQSVSISWRASHLLLAAIALWVTFLGWQLGENCFRPDGIETLPLSTFIRQVRFESGVFGGHHILPFSTGSTFTLDARSMAYIAFGIVWTIGVWAFAGGLLARRSLMEMGIRTSVGWGPSCRLICKRWLSMVWAIAMPLCGMLGLLLFPIVLGLLARLGVVGQFVSLVLMIPTVFVAIGIGWCTAITAFGFPLSICAISAEKNADAFDGVSRSAAYVFQRPMTILVILLLALGLGWIGDFIIGVVLSTGESIVWSAFSIGAGSNIQGRMSVEGSLRQYLLHFARTILPVLRFSFLFSFFWSASAAAYLTLRWEIDNTDFDELDLQELGEPIPIPEVKSEMSNA